MKYKILEAHYNKETGISYVKIQSKYGIFSATSKIHEEDKLYESSFTGCHIAELKARRKSYKYALRIALYKIEAIEMFKDKGDSKLLTIQQEKYLNSLFKQKKELQKQISLINKRIPDYLKQKEELQKLINKGQRRLIN